MANEQSGRRFKHGDKVQHVDGGPDLKVIYYPSHLLGYVGCQLVSRIADPESRVYYRETALVAVGAI